MILVNNIKSTFSNTRGWFLLFLCSIAIGLSLSKPLMSLGLFGLLIVWLVDGNIKQKIKAFWQNKTAVIISSIYLITVLGLVHTSNFEFAIDDLRRKLPLFFIPFYVTGFSPITKKELHFILKVFIAGVIIATFWSVFIYLGGLNVKIIDVRDYSRFNSHIRFGLEIALAIFFGFHYLYKSPTTKQKLLWLVITSWLIASLIIFNLFTGLAVFGITSSILLVVFGVTNPNRLIKFSAIIIFLGVILGGYVIINSSINKFNEGIATKTIEEKLFSKAGNKYQKDNHTASSLLKENGYFIEKHIAWGEFTEAWNAKSNIHFDSLDLKGQQLRNTLFRFITSKGQRKDKEAIDKLTPKEIAAIENGTPNYKYLEMNSFNIRFHKILWEYNAYTNGEDINGHSLLMRWVYWKTALKIIKTNLFFGVGTGGVQDAFNQQYKIDSSTLSQKYRLRNHNQFLAYSVAFGLVGLIWFLVCLFYPVFINGNSKNYLYLAFFTIVLLSMLTEDTLEIQTGINFFAFFNTLLLLNIHTKKRSVK